MTLHKTLQHDFVNVFISRIIHALSDTHHSSPFHLCPLEVGSLVGSLDGSRSESQQSLLFLTWNGYPSFTLAKENDFVIDHATEAVAIHQSSHQ